MVNLFLLHCARAAHEARLAALFRVEYDAAPRRPDRSEKVARAFLRHPTVFRVERFLPARGEPPRAVRQLLLGRDEPLERLAAPAARRCHRLVVEGVAGVRGHTALEDAGELGG